MRIFLITSIILFVFTGSASASIASFEIVNEKEHYNVNDTLLIKVSIKNTHRQCELQITDSEFKPNGLSLLKATKWKEIKKGHYERKVMVIIEETEERSLTVLRKCSNEGTYGKLDIK